LQNFKNTPTSEYFLRVLIAQLFMEIGFLLYIYCIQTQFVPQRKYIWSPLQSPTGWCLGNESLFIVKTIQVEVEDKLRPTVSRPVRLGVRHPSGTRDKCFIPLEIFFRQLRVCYFVTPSLTRGWVSNLLLLLVLASAVFLGSEFRETEDHIWLSQSWDSPNLEVQVPQEQGGPDIPPGLGSLPVASYDSQGFAEQKLHKKTQFVPQRKHIISPLQSLTS
jgi:hypothetical protein